MRPHGYSGYGPSPRNQFPMPRGAGPPRFDALAQATCGQRPRFPAGLVRGPPPGPQASPSLQPPHGPLPPPRLHVPPRPRGPGPYIRPGPDGLNRPPAPQHVLPHPILPPHRPPPHPGSPYQPPPSVHGPPPIPPPRLRGPPPARNQGRGALQVPPGMGPHQGGRGPPLLESYMPGAPIPEPPPYGESRDDLHYYPPDTGKEERFESHQHEYGEEYSYDMPHSGEQGRFFEGDPERPPRERDTGDREYRRESRDRGRRGDKGAEGREEGRGGRREEGRGGRREEGRGGRREEGRGGRREEPREERGRDRESSNRQDDIGMRSRPDDRRDRDQRRPRESRREERSRGPEPSRDSSRERSYSRSSDWSHDKTKDDSRSRSRSSYRKSRSPVSRWQPSRSRPDDREKRKRARSPSSSDKPASESEVAKEEIPLEPLEGAGGIFGFGTGEEEAKKAAEEDEPPIPAWTRSSPADIYFKRGQEGSNLVTTPRMQALECKFESELVQRASRVRSKIAPVDATGAHRLPYNIMKYNPHKGGCCGGSSKKLGESDDEDGSSSSSSSSESDDEDYSEEIRKSWMDAIERKKHHPERLHDELWFNEPNEMNDGPICRCSIKNRQAGIRHNIYPGEKPVEKCEANSNNREKMYHYQVTMSPHTNFLTKNPTTIDFDDHEYIFEGFSLFSHYKIEKVPVCKVIRFNIEYTIHWLETDMPENVSMKSMDLFVHYLYREVLELVDLDWLSPVEGCQRYHIMPRFARSLPDNGKEILSMNEVLQYLLRSSKPLLDEKELPQYLQYDKQQWQGLVDQVRGTIVTYPGKRPSSIRIDQLDRESIVPGQVQFPKIIHFGIRPAQLSYAGDPKYQKLWKQYMKFKHLLANKPKVSDSDKSKLKAQEEVLQDLRLTDTMKREMTVEISSQGFYRTGIHSDMTQHALLVPVLISHLRFHQCLGVLEERLSYTFNNRILLQLALTHPSYRIKFGTNPDHARNSLTNCGMRQLEYGDRRIHYVHTRKRGINTLFYIMSKLGRREEVQSEIFHYERLEFLGDAIVEFLTSIHLFFMFPGLEEGGLTMYRTAIVQNQHLTRLAGKLKLQDFMLYAHGPDLCRDSDLRHAMANCFEALMGALFIDGGIDEADRVFGDALFGDNNPLFHVWSNLPLHPLQEDEPEGDRHWVESSPPLQKLVKFEDSIGITFNHIRLLAKAFSMRNVGYNNLTMGHNQRLEFLGDTVLQLITSEHLFKFFPDHHEGHLSLLRSSLVNNRTQAVVCEDLGMTEYIINTEHKNRKQEGIPNDKLKFKDRADLVEAFLGSLYVDKGLEFCKVFCQVCFYPRLKEFIMNQDWNDPKSQLQQCCLTLRGLEEEDPDIPIYKVLESTGPTNTRKYTVAVYFKRCRLARGVGHSIQEAEMKAARNALKNKAELFPLVKHQQNFLDAKFKWKRKSGKKGKGDEKGDSEGSEEEEEEEDGGRQVLLRRELPAGYKEIYNEEEMEASRNKGKFRRFMRGGIQGIIRGKGRGRPPLTSRPTKRPTEPSRDTENASTSRESVVEKSSSPSQPKSQKDEKPSESRDTTKTESRKEPERSRDRVVDSSRSKRPRDRSPASSSSSRDRSFDPPRGERHGRERPHSSSRDGPSRDRSYDSSSRRHSRDRGSGDHRKDSLYRERSLDRSSGPPRSFEGEPRGERMPRGEDPSRPFDSYGDPNRSHFAGRGNGQMGRERGSGFYRGGGGRGRGGNWGPGGAEGYSSFQPEFPS